MNISNTIEPKSTQLNADDLIGEPKTIRIIAVGKGPSAEQPVSIAYEGGEGRPYLPGKSMRRVLVAMWGAEASAYAGRSLTLFRDPDVKFGGMDTGGIRISHATNIDAPFRIALTVTRGKRAPFTVQPLKIAAKPAAEEPPDVDLARDIGATKAGQGEAALKEWWTGLTPALRRALADELPKWKETAAAL